MVYFLLVVLSNFVVISESARILAVFPAPVLSHQIVFRVLTQELANRGHHVTVITSIPAYGKGQTPDNYTEIDINYAAKFAVERLLTEEISVSDLYSQFVNTFRAITDVIESLLQIEEVQTLIQDKDANFDLIFVEDCIRSTLIFSYIFKAPAISISSFGGTFNTFEIVGAATHPFLYPIPVRQRFQNLSALQKILEIYNLYRLEKVFNELLESENEILRKHFGTNTPSLRELNENIAMLFLNINPIWDSNRPVPTNVVYLGDLHQKQQKELPKDLKSALDSSTNGIIYVSFGTNINTEILTPKRLHMFVNVFSKLPYDIYMKWNGIELEGLSKNIRVLKWFPQSDLLQHHKVKLFITQGGLQSTDEAIAGGVPVLGIPMMWDQWYNVEKYVQLKIGLQLDINTITEAEIKDAIFTIIEDKSYKENMLRLRSVMQDQAQSSLERAVWWTEYVIRHGGAAHLRAPSANMTWTEYYEVKLVLTVISILMLTVAIILVVLHKIFIKFMKLKVKNE